MATPRPRPINGATSLPAHQVALALARLRAAHAELAEAVAACNARHGVRATGELLGIGHNTAARWATAEHLPGWSAIEAALAHASDHGAAEQRSVLQRTPDGLVRYRPLRAGWGATGRLGRLSGFGVRRRYQTR